MAASLPTAVVLDFLAGILRSCSFCSSLSEAPPQKLLTDTAGAEKETQEAPCVDWQKLAEREFVRSVLQGEHDIVQDHFQFETMQTESNPEDNLPPLADAPAEPGLPLADAPAESSTPGSPRAFGDVITPRVTNSTPRALVGARAAELGEVAGCDCEGRLDTPNVDPLAASRGHSTPRAASKGRPVVRADSVSRQSLERPDTLIKRFDAYASPGLATGASAGASRRVGSRSLAAAYRGVGEGGDGTSETTSGAAAVGLLAADELEAQLHKAREAATEEAARAASMAQRVVSLESSLADIQLEAQVLREELAALKAVAPPEMVQKGTSLAGKLAALKGVATTTAATVSEGEELEPAAAPIALDFLPVVS